MKKHLIKLNSKLDNIIEFAGRDEDESHLLRNTAVLGGGAAAAYGAGSAYRGLAKMGQEYGGGIAPQSAKQALTGLKVGNAANIADAKAAFGGAAAKSGAALKNVASKLRAAFKFSQNGEVVNFEESPDKHYVARTFLGTPLTSAIVAKKGEKIKAYAHQTGHGLYEMGKLGAAGAGIGAAIGSVAGRGNIAGAAAAGGVLGAYAGAFKGNYDKRSTEIMNKYRQ